MGFQFLLLYTMSKARKKAKARPEKYEDKVHINLLMDEALKTLAKDANDNVKKSLEERVDELNADKQSER